MNKINWYWDEIGLRSGLNDVDKLTDIAKMNKEITKIIGKWTGIDENKCKITVWGGQFGLGEGDIDKDPPDHYKGDISFNEIDRTQLRERGELIAEKGNFFSWIGKPWEDDRFVIQSLEVFLNAREIYDIRDACGVNKEIRDTLED